MTEAEYIVVSDLQRLRQARALIADTLPDEWGDGTAAGERRVVLRTVGAWVQVLEQRVEEAREREEEAR